MAQLAFGVAGAAIGGQFGQAGLGFTAGALVYSVLNPPDDIINEGSRLNNQLTTTSAYGVMRPITYGTMPINGNIIDGSQLYETVHRNKQDTGGKGFGGPDVVDVTYTYSVDLAIGLGEGEIEDVLQIYANERLIYDRTENATIVSPDWLKIAVYKGTEDQLPDPTLQVLHGEDTPAYRGEAYVVFNKFQLQEFGNQIPSFRFLVITKATRVNTYTTKSFAPSGNLGALLQDRKTNLIYYASSGQQNIRIGHIYDPRTEDIVGTFNWPEPDTNFDEEPAGALFSLASVIDDVYVPQGPNAHFGIQIEDPTAQPALAIYDTKTSAYIGKATLPVGDDVNTKLVPFNEFNSYFLKESYDSENFYSRLKHFQIISTGGLLTVIENPNVEPPIENRDGIREWNWNLDPSYPEGTTRGGKIAVLGSDGTNAPTNDDYLCIIGQSESTVEAYTLLTEYATNDITAIVWDSVQEYFWVIGQSLSGQTRIKAYDIFANEIAGTSYEITSTIYVATADYTTYDPSNFLIWFYDYNTGTIYTWDTIGHTLDSIPGFLAGTGSGDSLIYINSTNSLWRKKGNADLDIYRLGRLQDDGIGLDQIVADLCTRAGLAPNEYDVSDLATKIVKGYKIERDGNIRSKIVPLQQGYLFDGIDKADLIEWKFRGDPAVDSIEQNSLGATDGTIAGGEYIEINRIMDLDLPKKTEVTYYNRDLEYEQNTQMARRTASYVKENSTRIVLPIVFTDDEGIQLADVLEHLAYIERELYDIRVLPEFQYLVNGDVIDINYDNKIFTARIIQKDFEDGLVRFRCSREDSAILQSFLSGGSGQDRDVTIRYNPLTQSVHLDIPLLLDINDNAGYYLSACGADDSWTGGNIYKSPDGNSFNYTATVVTPSTIGSIETALPSVIDHSLWDRTNVVRFKMLCGSLESKTELEVLRGENTFALGSHGRWEIIGIANVTLIEPGLYECNTFLRGRLGSEWTVGTHQVGDVLCQLSTDDLTYLSDSLANLNRQFLYRAVSLGGNIYSDRVVDQFHTNTGVCLKPYAPALFEANKDVNTLDILFTWRPRSRYPWANYWSGVESNVENYELDIVTPGGTVTKTGITTGQYLYTRADQLADGFTADAYSTTASVTHLSTTVGRGYLSTISISVGPFPDPVLEYAFSIGAGPIWPLTEASESEPAQDITGIFNATYTNANDLITFGEPSLYPATTEGSIIIDRFGRVVANEMPIETIDFLNYSLVFFLQIQESSLRDQQLISLDLGIEVGIRWLPGNIIRFWHSNGQIGESPTAHDVADPLVIGNTVMVTYAFNSNDPNVYGDAKLYINNQVALDMSDIRMRGLDDELKTMIAGYGTSCCGQSQELESRRISSIMIFDHKLTKKEVENLYYLSGL